MLHQLMARTKSLFVPKVTGAVTESTLHELIARSKADPAFIDICERFDRANIENWLWEDEKALHFGVGAFAPGEGVVVEIGTYKGASATFAAAGIARRGRGQLN